MNNIMARVKAMVEAFFKGKAVVAAVDICGHQCESGRDPAHGPRAAEQQRKQRGNKQTARTVWRPEPAVSGRASNEGSPY